jgi:hypothetical protein
MREKDGTFKGPVRDLQRHNLGFKPRADRDASPERVFPGKSRAPAPLDTAGVRTEGPAPVVPGAEGQPEPAKPKFKFGGAEWDNQEHAEKSFSTMRGSFKANEAKYSEEARKAWGWHSMYKQTLQELESIKSGKPAGATEPNPASQPAAAPGSSGDPNDPFAGIDMGVYKLLAETDGPMAAAAWLQHETAVNQAKRVEAQITEAIAPFREAQQRTAETEHVVGQVDDLYHFAASQRNADGSPVFSEIGNPQAERELGEIVGWLCSQGVPQEFAISPIGMKIASALRREALGQSQAAVTAAPNQAAAAVAEALLAAQPGQEPVSGPSARTTQPGQAMTREQQVKSEIRGARHVDPVLGFARRSAPI